MTVALCAPPPAATPSANPGAAYLAHQNAINEAIQRVAESGWYLQGAETDAFEAEFARYLGVEHVITTGSGTDALVLALRTLGVGTGDAVLTVAHTAVATVTAIDLVGALPILVDVDPQTYCMDPAHLEAELQAHPDHRIRAIIPVHLYGHPAALREIGAIAQRHGIPVIEDCAQAHGATVDGRRVGGFGALGAFSFYPTKNLGALGDGGALVTNDALLAQRAQCLKQYGWKERYVSHLPGMNTRLDELQAAVLRAKLPYLDGDNARRREIARGYDDALRDTPLTLPGAIGPIDHVFHQYVVQCDERAGFRDFLARRQVGTAVHYPVPVHQQPGYCGRVRTARGGLSETERLCNRVVSLPLYPSLTDEEVEHVGSTINDWFRSEHA